MADPLSLVASAAGVISLGITTASGIVHYYSAWEDYNDDVKQTFELIKSLRDLLIVAQGTTSSVSGKHVQAVHKQVFTLIQSAEDSIQVLQKRWEKINARAPPYDPQAKRDALDKFHNYGRRSLYPLQQGTLGKLRDSALEAQDLVTSALQLLNM